jgi:cyanophycinase
MNRGRVFVLVAVAAINIVGGLPIHLQAASGPAQGTVIPIGGGSMPQEVAMRFVELAGGSRGRIVYIPTADNDAGFPADYRYLMRVLQVPSVTILHTRDRVVADSDAFVAPLRSATGVFLEGGYADFLVDAYLHTKTQTELQSVLDRGGVIAGTSSGARVLASYLVRPVPAQYYNTDVILIRPGYEEGFGFIHGVSIDAHVGQRHREAAMSRVVTAHPDILGIGLDESTAIVIRGDQFEVIGRGRVYITDGKDHDGKPYYPLSRGAHFSLATQVTTK